MKFLREKSLRYLNIVLVVLLTFIGTLAYMNLYLEYCVEEYNREIAEYTVKGDSIWGYAKAIVLNKNDNLFYAKIDDQFYSLDCLLVTYETDSTGQDVREDLFVFNSEISKYVYADNYSVILKPQTKTVGEGRVLALASPSRNFFYSNPGVQPGYETDYIYKELAIRTSDIKSAAAWLEEQHNRELDTYKEANKALLEINEYFVKPYSPYAKIIAGICTFLVFVIGILILCGAGYGHNKENEQPQLLIWDRIGYAIHLAMMCAIAGAGWIPFSFFYNIDRTIEGIPVVISIAVGTSATVLAVGWFLETTVVRLRLGSFWKTTTVYYIWKAIKMPVTAFAKGVTKTYYAAKDGRTGVNAVIKATEDIVAGNITEIDLDTINPHYREFAARINDLADGKTKAVEEMIKSERMRTDLITNVSHDIKTPLTSIISYTDLLSRKAVMDSEAKEYMDVVASQSARLKNLLTDLIEASKASSGVLPVNMEELQADVMLTQIISEFDDKFASRRLTVITNVPEGIRPVLADGKHLSRVLYNLCSNVVKYAMEGTRVYVDVQQDLEHTYIVMKNTSAEALNISTDELMERFMRGDTSRTREGSGLGLSIADSLMQLMGGSLSLDIDGDLFKAKITL